MAKDGSGTLGAIMNENGIVGQARWIPVDKAVGPACIEAMLIAVAVLAVVKQVKDIRSYVEQIEGMVSANKKIFEMQTSSKKIGKILDRFIHYKLALHVFVLSQYMEVMLSKNFQSEYLNKISDEIQEYAFQFRNLYTFCYDKIELLKSEAVTTQAAKKVANVSKTVGNIIGKIPVVSKGQVDECLIEMSDFISEAEKEQMKKTLSFFIQYKESGLIPMADHIDMINKLSNKPTVMVYDKKVVHFYELKELV